MTKAGPLCLKALTTLMEAQVKANNFNRVLQNVKLVSAENGRVTAQLQLGQEELNIAGTLHGGMSSTLVDCISTFALLTLRNCRSSSIEMNMSFLNSAKAGETVMVDAITQKMGGKVAFLDVKIKNSQGDLLVTARHTKMLMSNVDYFGNKI